MAASKILIVDDDPDILTVLEQRLSPCGYEISMAKDGEEAIAKVRSGKPDLIIMDVLMPKMTGYDALRKIREDNELRKIPAIMVSARGVMRDFFTDLSRVEFIPKPYDAQELLGKVRRLLGVAGASVVASPVASSVAPAPASSVASSSASSPASAPPPSGAQSRSVIVLGVQDGLVEKLQTMISSMGIEVERALNEEDACKPALKMRPEKIFCQFWEDEKVLDAKKLASQFLKTPALAGVSFYVFCESRCALEAMKVFREEKIISYQEARDLLTKMGDVLKSAV